MCRFWCYICCLFVCLLNFFLHFFPSLLLFICFLTFLHVNLSVHLEKQLLNEHSSTSHNSSSIRFCEMMLLLVSQVTDNILLQLLLLYVLSCVHHLILSYYYCYHYRECSSPVHLLLLLSHPRKHTIHAGLLNC